MASIPRNNRGRRLRLAVAGAAVLTALTVATAGAVVAAPPAAVSVDITPQLPAPAALAQSTSLPSADLGLAASRQTPADPMAPSSVPARAASPRWVASPAPRLPATSTSTTAARQSASTWTPRA
jgi:hypothetical protein